MLRVRSNPRAGFTLLEVIIAVSITAVAMVVVGNILMSSTNSVDYMMTDTTSDQEIKRALNNLLDELSSSSTTVLAIDTSNRDQDMVTLQTPAPYAGALTWGAKSSGVWQAGYSSRYVVTGGNLVRRVLDGGGNAVGADELMVRRVDGLSGGLKGFRVTRNGTVVNAAIRIRKTFRDNHDYTKEFSSSVLLKNS